ncbi:unnamed protein product [Rotaria socialis]
MIIEFTNYLPQNYRIVLNLLPSKETLINSCIISSHFIRVNMNYSSKRPECICFSVLLLNIISLSTDMH